MTDDTQEYIQVLDNIIWFYADIEEATCLQLNKVLYEADRKAGPDGIIHLHINSYGGSVLAAFSTIDTIRALKSKVYTYVDGSAASAGTLISVFGSKRFIGKYSHMLIHQVSGESSGKLQEMEDEIKNTRQLMDLIKKIYKTKTKLNGKALDELLKSDIWLDSDTCVKNGLVDEII